MHKVYKVIGVEYKKNAVKSTSSLRLDLTRNGFYRTMDFKNKEAELLKSLNVGDTLEIEED